MSEKPKVMFGVQYGCRECDWIRTIPQIRDESTAIYIALGMLTAPNRVPLGVFQYGGGEDYFHIWQTERYDYDHVLTLKARYEEELVLLSEKYRVLDEGER